METGRNPAWEQDGHAPVRACGGEDVGGAPNPSTFKGECGSCYPKNRQIKEFSLPLHAGPGNAPKGALLGLGGGVNAFFCIVSYW